MLSVANKPITLIVILLIVIMLSIIMLRVIMLSVIMLKVIHAECHLCRVSQISPLR